MYDKYKQDALAKQLGVFKHYPEVLGRNELGRSFMHENLILWTHM
jgi:hypothetical protein